MTADSTGASPTPSAAEKAWRKELERLGLPPDTTFDSRIGDRGCWQTGYAAAEAHYAPLVEAAAALAEYEIRTGSGDHPDKDSPIYGTPIKWVFGLDQLRDALLALRAARQTAKKEL